jgi:hypothetical protein
VTNTYFPQVLIHKDALSEAIRKHWSSLQTASNPEFARILKNVPEIGVAFAIFTNEEVYHGIVRMQGPVVRKALPAPKIAGYDLLASGDRFIGADAPNEPLFAETIEAGDVSRSRESASPCWKESLPCTRPKAVTCFYGFARLEPAPTIADEMLDEVIIAADGTTKPPKCKPTRIRLLNPGTGWHRNPTAVGEPSGSAKAWRACPSTFCWTYIRRCESTRSSK